MLDESRGHLEVSFRPEVVICRPQNIFGETDLVVNVEK